MLSWLAVVGACVADTAFTVCSVKHPEVCVCVRVCTRVCIYPETALRR